MGVQVQVGARGAGRRARGPGALSLVSLLSAPSARTSASRSVSPRTRARSAALALASRHSDLRPGDTPRARTVYHRIRGSSEIIVGLSLSVAAVAETVIILIKYKSTNQQPGTNSPRRSRKCARPR